jgi:hypothetical protein
MSIEMYSYDKYKGFDIYIEDDSGFFYGDIYFNGTQLYGDIKAMSPEKCLARCEDKVDAFIAKEQGE